MNTEIRFISTAGSDVVTAHVKRHIGYTLGRFFERIDRVVVRFEDLNGPRGGVDKLCRIEADGDFGKRFAEARGGDLYAVSARALDVLERSVARAIRRHRAFVKNPAPVGFRGTPSHRQ